MGNSAPSCALCSQTDAVNVECVPDPQSAEAYPEKAALVGLGLCSSDAIEVASTVDFSDADRASEHLEAGFELVRDLCAAGQVFEAYRALQVLEAEVDLACKQCEVKADAIRAFANRLISDPVLVKLRDRHMYLQDSLALLSVFKTPKKPNKSWFETEAAEPKAGPHTRAHVSGRWLEGTEREPKGPASQAIVVTKLSNVPLSIAHFVSVYMETDLLRPEFFQDMKSFEGAPGSRENLYSAYHHNIVSPSLFPMLKLFSDTLVIVAVCPIPPEPLRHLGPGVLISQRSVPAGATNHKGFKIVDKPSRAIRVDAGTLSYLTPSKEIAGAINMTTFSKVCAPLPRSMFPLHVGAKLCLGISRGNLVRWKEKIADHIHESSERATRIAASPEFYGAINELSAEARPVGCAHDVTAI
jgi:hypothetical protein